MRSSPLDPPLSCLNPPSSSHPPGTATVSSRLFLRTTIPSPANGVTGFPAFLFFPGTWPRDKAGVMVVLHGRGSADEPLTFESLLARYPYVEALASTAEATGNVICIPLLGSFAHLDSPVRGDIRRATFLGRELPAWLGANHGLIPGRLRWSLVGFSMGGTAAINLLARYPGVYATASNYGGNCDPAFYPKVLGRPSPAEDVLGPYATFPERFAEWSNDHALDLLAGRSDFAVSLGCGLADPRLPMIRAQRDRLAQAGVPTTYAEYPGGHVFELEHLLMQIASLGALRKMLEKDADPVR